MNVIQTQSAHDDGVRLSPNEAYLLRMFRQVTATRQAHVLVFMEQSLSDPSNPRVQPKSHLRMVKGGAA